jgi:sugar lactone lactonase YvrE
LGQPFDIALDTAGNVYIADNWNNRIRKVDAVAGIITTVAGTGVQGFSGDGGQATAAKVDRPFCVALDIFGNIYFSTNDNRIRKVTVSSGVITTIAGDGTGWGYNGDNILATSAKLYLPWGLIIDSSGNIYFADQANQRIRKITSSTGIITTVAGTGVQGFSGDGGQAIAAQLNNPQGIALDALGNIYFSDAGNMRIRKVDITSGVITTIAGNGAQSFGGDGGSAILAEFSQPIGIDLDILGNIYIADYQNDRIRKIDILTGIVSTVAGDSVSGYNGDSILATSAQLNQCGGVALDRQGNIYIAEAGNNRIRKVSSCAVSVHYQTTVDTTYFNSSSVDTLVTLQTDTTLNSVINHVDSVFISTYTSIVTVINDSTIFSVNQCDSSITTLTYLDTVTNTVISYDTVTHQSSDTVILINTGIQTNSSLLMAKVYPNPFTNQLVVDVGDEVATIELVDVLGNLITQRVCNKNSVLTLHVFPGFYFLQVSYKEKPRVIFKVLAE